MPFEFKSPGAEAYKAIQEVLARRRVEEQQAFLNKIMEEERADRLLAQSETQRMAREQLALQQKEEQRMAEVSKAQIAEAEAKRLASNLAGVTTGTPAGDLSAELRSYGQGLGRFGAAPILGPPEEGQEMSSIPGMGEYLGTPEELEKERIKTTLSDLFSQLQIAKTPSDRTALAGRIISEGGPPIPEYFKERAPLRVMGPTGKITEHPDIMLPESQSFRELAFAPPIPTSQVSRLVQLYRGGRFVRTEPLIRGSEREATLASEGYELREGAFQQQIESGPASALRNKVTEARQALIGWGEAYKGRSWYEPKGPYDVGIKNARGALGAALGQMLDAATSLSPKTKEIVFQIETNADLANLPTQKAIDAAFIDPEGNPLVLTPEEIAEVDAVRRATGSPAMTIQGAAPIAR